MVEIAAAIERGIAGQAHFVATLATAMFAGTVALRFQVRSRSNAKLAVRRAWAFWVATGLVLPTVGIAFAISGLLIELAPILFSFSFDTAKEFSSQNFPGNRFETLMGYSRAQVVAFVLFAVFAATFVLTNLTGKPD